MMVLKVRLLALANAQQKIFEWFDGLVYLHKLFKFGTERNKTKNCVSDKINKFVF